MIKAEKFYALCKIKTFSTLVAACDNITAFEFKPQVY